ncbi:MAG: ABC transporter ATP-binding protein [Phycisphaerae bacterium]
MTATAVHCPDLSVSTGAGEILRLRRHRIEAGELVALLGPNGAGKTTYLRCLLGMQSHARGQLSVLGRELARLGAGEMAALRQRVGYVPQMLPARSEMPLTVREVVAIGRTGVRGLLRRLRREDRRIVDEWIDRLGLSELAQRGFGDISGGEQRKTLIARAMVQQPEMLLLDEPTANLDLGWRERIVALIDELYRSMSLTVILVCHELEVLPPSCGRVVVLEDGRVVADGACADVLTTALIEELYGRGLDVVGRSGRWTVVPRETTNV